MASEQSWELVDTLSFETKRNGDALVTCIRLWWPESVRWHCGETFYCGSKLSMSQNTSVENSSFFQYRQNTVLL